MADFSQVHKRTTPRCAGRPEKDVRRNQPRPPGHQQLTHVEAHALHSGLSALHCAGNQESSVHC